MGETFGNNRLVGSTPATVVVVLVVVVVVVLEEPMFFGRATGGGGLQCNNLTVCNPIILITFWTLKFVVVVVVFEYHEEQSHTHLFKMTCQFINFFCALFTHCLFS